MWSGSAKIWASASFALSRYGIPSAFLNSQSPLEKSSKVRIIILSSPVVVLCGPELPDPLLLLCGSFSLRVNSTDWDVANS